MKLTATRLSLWLPKVLFPDTVEVLADRVIVIKRRWFGLATDREEVKLERIASVKVSTGILFAKVTIETMGGAVADVKITNLWKGDALMLRDALEG